VPYERPDGRSWDEAEDRVRRRIIARMANYIDNVPDVVLEYHCDSPVDMERTVPELLPRRPPRHRHHHLPVGQPPPTPELGQYRVPGIERLYLVGPVPAPRRRRVRRWAGDGDGHGGGPRDRIRPDRSGVTPFHPTTVILNLFQDPSRPTAMSVRVERWALKQVQGDERGGRVL
jgi:hypothetical protein